MNRYATVYRMIALLTALMILLLAGAQAMAEAVSYDVIYSSENPIPEIVKRVRPSIVMITTSVESWDADSRRESVDPFAYGSASYFRADEDGTGGYLLTNYHIVEDGDTFSAKWLDGTEMDLELVGYDNGTDIAVLRFEDAAPADAQPIPLGDSDALQIGELAICIGNPGTSEKVLFGTVTAGIISGLQREDINAGNFSHAINVIQTDAPINSGNSGGALLNSKGELVGIPTMKIGLTYYDVFEGMSFCIPISAVSDYIDQLIDKGNVMRPRMGVSVTSIDGPEKPMKRFPPAGAKVVEVEPGTPAFKAGVKVDDIIIECNEARVSTASDLVSAVDKCNVGDEVKLKIVRYKFGADGALSESGFEEVVLSLNLELLD